MVDHDSARTTEPYALSPKDAAKRLGIDVSTLYRHYGAAMRRGTIRVLRIGRSVRIIWRSLLDYIEGQNNGRT
jgi:excisionase family DNA binding protein